MSRRKKKRSIKKTLWRLIYRTTLLLLLVTIALVLPLRWINPPTTSFIVQAHFRHSASIQYQWTPLREISPHLAIAVLASEDQRFPNHWGFDIRELARAVSQSGRLRGASTITQQVAKNLYLWPGRSYVRKLLEAGFSVALESLLPKKRILELYLNIAQFGPRIYGARAAARIFYGRSASNLNQRQAAVLAAVLPNPERMSALEPSDYVLTRASEIQRSVKSLGGTAYLGKL